MSKYEPLKRFLTVQPASELPLSFADVERELGFSLPGSARRHAPWWANETEGGHVQARAWLDAGWKTARVDVPGERVVFVRASRGSPTRPTAPSDGPPAHREEVVLIDIGALPPPASRLLRDYAKEAGGDFSKAVARGLHEAAIARRGRLIDQVVAAAPRSPLNSVDLIREDRDAR